MATTRVAEPMRPRIYSISSRDLMRIAITGAVVGFVVVILYMVLDKYILTPTLCGHPMIAASRCDNKLAIANTLAMIIGAFVALFAVVQMRVFRPLLIVLLVTVGLWNVVMVMSSIPWWLVSLVTAGIFALAYATFAWIVQLRNFLLALGLGIVVVIALRLILSF